MQNRNAAPLPSNPSTSAMEAGSQTNAGEPTSNCVGKAPSLQLKVSGGDIKSVQGNTGHAQANVLVNTYAHIQDRSRLELSHKFEEDFYRHSPNSDTDKADMDSSEVSCDLLLQAIRNATPEQKKQLTLALLA